MKRLLWLVPILCVVLAAGLSVITANAAPNGTTTLSAGQTLTIKANTCNLKVKKETPALVQVVCKAATNLSAPSERNPFAKVILNVGQKQKVLANQCDLRVTKKSAAVVKVKCVGSANASPTATKTATQVVGATNTHTPTRTATQVAGATNTRTPTMTATRTPTATATQTSGTTIRVSVSSNGTLGNRDSDGSAISANGRYVAFESDAFNLVTGDSNAKRDIFVRDLQTGTTTRASVSSNGTQANDSSYSPSISADGRYVAFASVATNLVADDTNQAADVFVHDMQTGTTVRVSLNCDGTETVGFYSDQPYISANGRYVAFHAWGDLMGCGDSNGNGDVFVHDMQTGTTTLVSVSSEGVQGTAPRWGDSQYPFISANGRFVVFSSGATNLVDDDTNLICDYDSVPDYDTCDDIFVHDMQTGETTRVSVATDGTEGNDRSNTSPYASISDDGRYVVFSSDASNLVANDTNEARDVFLHDRQTGTTTRISLDPDGNAFEESASIGQISGNGRYVTFTAGNHDQPPPYDNLIDNYAFVRDLQTNTTTKYSLAADGSDAGPDAYGTSISSDGQYALFWTDAASDGNGYRQVYMRKRW